MCDNVVSCRWRTVRRHTGSTASRPRSSTAWRNCPRRNTAPASSRCWMKSNPSPSLWTRQPPLPALLVCEVPVKYSFQALCQSQSHWGGLLCGPIFMRSCHYTEYGIHCKKPVHCWGKSIVPSVNVEKKVCACWRCVCLFQYWKTGTWYNLIALSTEDISFPIHIQLYHQLQMCWSATRNISITNVSLIHLSRVISVIWVGNFELQSTETSQNYYQRWQSDSQSLIFPRKPKLVE